MWISGRTAEAGGRSSQLETGCRSENRLAYWGLCGPLWPMVEQPKPRCERSAAMVERRTWVNIAVRPCLHSLLTHNKHHLFENKVWDFYKEVYSFVIEVVIISWLCSHVYLYTCSCMWLYNTSPHCLLSSRNPASKERESKKNSFFYWTEHRIPTSALGGQHHHTNTLSNWEYR